MKIENKIVQKISNSSNSLNEEEQKDKEKHMDNIDNVIKPQEKKSTFINYIINHKINYIIKFNLTVHNLTKEELNIKEINDIIYNEYKRIVSKFKDHLIYNDPAEFLRKYILIKYLKYSLQK